MSKAPINKAQITAIQIARRKLGLDEATYHDIISQYTDGRTTSSTTMLFHEAASLIDYFNRILPASDKQKADKMRKKILAQCHTIRWYIKGTSNIDYESLDKWMVKFSYLHKPLNEYSYKELPKLVSQFKNVTIHYLTTV